MTNEFQISSEMRSDSLILITNGYINNYGGEKILEEFSKYPVTDYKKVIVNLENSHVVNSIGISFLIEIMESITQNNRKLIFTNLDPSVDNTFEIMDMYQYSEKAKSIEDALLL